jgi:tetratricopeptide (TPR) repeat protein
MRKEPILFAAVAVLGAWFVQSRLGGSDPRAEPRSKAQEYEAVPLPDVTRSAAQPDRQPDFGRDLFSQPRDTTPLPPLGLVPPPLEPLGALAPPSPWGPAPALHARFLRTAAPAAAGQLVAGLFEVAEEISLEDVVKEFDPDDPEQRAARIESFKRQYDWIYQGNFKFGQIRNEDRYRLAQRPNDPIEFYEVDPATGQSRFVGTTGALKLKREGIEEFGFAATTTNELELERLTFGASLSSTDFERGLRFADRCVELRHEAPRALEIAEEMYLLVEAVNLQGDPRPRLGLARCYEYGYDYERAYATYQALLSSGEATQPRALARRGMFRAALRLDDQAEADLRRAVDVARTDWEVRQHYGRFLMARGREDEALAQFVVAVEHEPRGEEEEELGPRVRLRLDLAGALLANGRCEEALERFTRALTADPEDRTGSAQIAAAGIAAATLLQSAGGGTSGSSGLNGGAAGAGQGAATPDARFELLLTSGLVALRAGRFVEARTALELARRADPFREYLATGALSFLAESAGYPEEALAYIEEAFLANPVDPWVLYQRGRILLGNGDAAGAEVSFRAALDREIDYAPALEELGALMVELGKHDAAELYFERALSLEPTRAVTWSRRGFNHVILGDLDQAKLCFERARVESPSLASAGIGLAWWHYASGDSQEAVTLFAQLEEDRRNESAQDPVRVYTKAQGDRIRDHETKETWRDRFDREPGRIANGWRQEEGFGPESLLRDGKVVIEGTLDRKGRTRVFQELETERFLSFFADLTITAENREATAGIFISVERTRGDQAAEAQAEILLVRGRDGTIRAKVRRSSSDDGTWQDAPAGPEWPIGKPVRVGLERVGDETTSTFTLYVSGEPVFTGLPGDGIQRSRQAVRFGVFSDGEASRRSSITMDDVEVVRRR